MRERGIALLLALASLVAFYGLFLQPEGPVDPAGDTARPRSTERRGNGYAAAYEWLERSGVRVRSLRERYGRLEELDLTKRGNLLVLTLPALEVFRTDEFAPLDRWVREGNTLLIAVALADAPDWAGQRQAGAVVEVESLTGLEFETRAAREDRLDDTPPAERARRADESEDAGENAGEDGELVDAQRESAEATDQPIVAHWTVSGPHPLTRGVEKLAVVSDYRPEEWALRMPYDNFALTLARDENTGEGVFFEQRLGAGRILLLAGGTAFTNRALGKADNSRLLANIVAATVAPGGAVLFDDLRQGLAASYDPARFYEDSRLHVTIAMLLGLWLVWVLGSTRLRAPRVQQHDPSEADLVRRAGGLLARAVAPHHTALGLFDLFFSGVARVARPGAAAAAGRDELWTWLERHAAIRPQDLDALKSWYADAHAERKVPLVPLQNLLDNIEKRLET